MIMNKNKGHFSDILAEFEKEIPILATRKTERKMLIAAVLDDILSERGWNKTRFAKEADQQQSVVTKWLSGTHNFTVDTLEEIGLALNVDMFLKISEFEKKESNEWILVSKMSGTAVGTTYDIDNACMQLTLSTIGKTKINTKSYHYKQPEMLS